MQLLSALCLGHQQASGSKDTQAGLAASQPAAEAEAAPWPSSSGGGARREPCCPASPTAFSLFRVPHVSQDYNWDCGVACALMVLRAFGLPGHDLPALRAQCGTRSIWTIDLAHLLARCGCAPTLLTLTLGANPSYALERFYAEDMAEDEQRVGRLFQEAGSAGINVQQRSVPAGELEALLLGGQHLVIALVDKNKLSAGTGVKALLPTGQVPGSGMAGAGFPPAVLPPPAQQAAYTGHYVLLCGFDAAAAVFLVADPASPLPLQHVPAVRLEAARRSFGTDEDLLLIPIPPALQLEAAARGELGPGL